MPDAIQHPTRSQIAEYRETQARLESYVPPRDPWEELRQAAMKMAGARSAYALSMAYERPADVQAEAGRDLDHATGVFCRLLSEIETCYAGVTVGHCTACGALRRMSKPREWEPEIVANGGPKWTSECGHCGSTVAVADRQKKDAADGAGTPATASDAA